MVPSDQGDSSFSNRHARSELGSPRHREVSLLLCTGLLSPTLRRACVFCLSPSIEARISERPFTHPQRLPACASHLGEVIAPDLFLRFPTGSPSNPFGLRLPSSTAIIWLLGEAQHLKPVARLCI